MTIPTAAPASWSQSQILAITTAEIPSIVSMFSRFSFAQLNWFAGAQLSVLLTSQGPGVLNGSWGDMPKSFNQNSLAEAIAQKSPAHLASVSWSQAFKYPSVSLANLIPRLSNDRFMAVNWFN